MIRRVLGWIRTLVQFVLWGVGAFEIPNVLSTIRPPSWVVGVPPAVRIVLCVAYATVLSVVAWPEGNWFLAAWLYGLTAYNGVRLIGHLAGMRGWQQEVLGILCALPFVAYIMWYGGRGRRRGHA